MQSSTFKVINERSGETVIITRRVSNQLYLALVALLALLSAANLFLPQGNFLPTMPVQELPAARPVMALAVIGVILVFYGGLGWLGLLLASRLGWPDLWEPGIPNRHRLWLPALVGGAAGLFFILADLLFSRFRPSGPLPHPPFPTSLVASATAGIGEEMGWLCRQADCRTAQAERRGVGGAAGRLLCRRERRATEGG